MPPPRVDKKNEFQQFSAPKKHPIMEIIYDAFKVLHLTKFSNTKFTDCGGERITNKLLLINITDKAQEKVSWMSSHIHNDPFEPFPKNVSILRKKTKKCAAHENTFRHFNVVYQHDARNIEHKTN